MEDDILPTPRYVPFSEEARALGAKSSMRLFPSFFRAGGYSIPWAEMYPWMRCVNYQFEKEPSYTDILEVLDFAEETVPRELCE